jgi:hypothetical protein
VVGGKFGVLGEQAAGGSNRFEKPLIFCIFAF